MSGCGFSYTVFHPSAREGMICGHVMDADREGMFHLLVMLLGLGLGEVTSAPPE